MPSFPEQQNKKPSLLEMFANSRLGGAIIDLLPLPMKDEEMIVPLSPTRKKHRDNDEQEDDGEFTDDQLRALALDSENPDTRAWAERQLAKRRLS